MKLGLRLMLLLPLLLSGATTAQEKASADRDKLKGTWQLVSMETSGKKAPEEKVRNTTMVITDDKATMKHGDKVVVEYTFTLDPTKKPKQMDWTVVGKPRQQSFGIYDLDGDTLKLCMSHAALTPRPSEFATKAPKSGDDFTSIASLILLKRVKK